jgi:hypothetical protein
MGVSSLEDVLAGTTTPRPNAQNAEVFACPEDEENISELEKAAAAMYGFKIEGERRREAGFKDEIRRRRREAELTTTESEKNKQYQLAELERILRLLSNGLRRTIDGDPNADEVECSPRWLTEAKEAVTDLDKFQKRLNL